MIGTGAGSRITIGSCIAKTFHGDRGKAAFTRCRCRGAAMTKRTMTIDDTVDMLKKLKDVIDTHGAEQIVHAPSFRAIDYVEAAVIVNLRQVDRVIDLLEVYRDEF
jgi:hypothetical protein